MGKEADVISFVRQKDLIFVRELGEGATGKTILLHDDILNQDFVCKKYQPYAESERQALFERFVQEIKPLYLANHPNVVRVFSYYLYPDKWAGYILMELIEGTDIESYLQRSPERLEDVFRQVIGGFLHLENRGILHRDIRPDNIVVGNDGRVTIIDFGFGKLAQLMRDFGKSISLNWWVEPPPEVSDGLYDFATEVYFVGHLFRRIMAENKIQDFPHADLIRRMCARDTGDRPDSFQAVERLLTETRVTGPNFTPDEIESYRALASELSESIKKIEQRAAYVQDADEVLRKLEVAHEDVMLEQWVPSGSSVIRCFLDGAYYYSKRHQINVAYLADFVALMRNCSRDRRNIVLRNIHSRLDVIERYSEPAVDPYADTLTADDDIPF